MSFSKHRSSTVLSRVHFHSCFFPKENNQIKKPQIRSPFFIPRTQSSHQESIKKYILEAISDEQRVGSFKLISFKNILDSDNHFASYFDYCFVCNISNYFA
jgi:hypothetical protein